MPPNIIYLKTLETNTITQDIQQISHNKSPQNKMINIKSTNQTNQMNNTSNKQNTSTNKPNINKLEDPVLVNHIIHLTYTDNLYTLII